jgi:hypothetical protein
MTYTSAPMDWESRIRSLEQCICRLLIKNEQLRMSLALAKMPEGERWDDSYNGRSTVEQRILNGRNT